jgi:hypothetical protein
MSGPVEPLESDVASLLDAAKELDPVSPETSDRVLATVVARLAVLPPGGGGGTAAGGDAIGASPAHARRLGRPALLFGAVCFGLGVAVGFSARRPPAPAERVVYVDRTPPPLPSTSPAAPPTVPVDALPATRPSSFRSDPAAPRPAVAPSGSRERLAAESAILDVARVAVAQGEGDRALQAVERHRIEFPNGVLSEEREALTVRALHLVGRDAEARSHAVRFEQAHPKSLFLPAIRSVLDPP